VRTFISLPAGVARMPFWRFTLLTVLGCIPWVFMLVFIGKQAGDNWERWKEHLHYIDYAVVAAIILGLIWLFLRYRKRRAGASAPDASSA
jgi:membrane protein DedA with SNARE-associated domain